MTAHVVPGLVYTVILNWNGLADTVACIRSCQQLAYPHNTLLVVDNGSTDGSVAGLRELFPDLEIIETGANLGYAGGCNVGIETAQAHGAEFVWLLNNDTTVDPAALGELVATLQAWPKAGIAGSKIFYATRPDVLWFAGGEVSARWGYVRHRGQDETDIGQYDVIQPCDFITGCSLLIRSNVVSQIGLMREDYFLYWEDVDWNATSAAAGWESLFVPTSLVWHSVSGSSKDAVGRTNTKPCRYEMRNRILYHRRHLPWRLAMVVLGACRYAMEQFVCECKPRLGIAALRGMVDGLLNRTGPIRD
jgi:GT2 family glycosyltransferase